MNGCPSDIRFTRFLLGPACRGLQRIGVNYVGLFLRIQLVASEELL
jgi:hypothetical protein